MKILILTNRIPYPENDGGNKAVAQVLYSFLEDSDMDVSLLSMNTTKHFVDINHLPDIYKKLSHFDTVTIDNKLSPFKALLGLITNKSYHISRFISEEYSSKLKELLSKVKYDIIWLEGLFVTPYIDIIKKVSDTPIFYRQHNIEYKIWQKLADSTTSYIKKEYLNILTRQLKKFEQTQLRKVNVIVPISPIDESINYNEFKLKTVSFLLPYCINLSINPSFKNKNDRTKLYHIGAMDWLPNQEGIDWFLNEVWDKIIKQNPKVSFHFAGRNMPEKYHQLKLKNVFCYGEVQDAQAFVNDNGILIVPLQSASGIRIKTIEAMTLGKAVVSTSIGANGLNFTDKKELIIADDATTFSESILSLIDDEEKYNLLVTQAFDSVKQNYSLSNNYQRLKEFLKRYIKD